MCNINILYDLKQNWFFQMTHCVAIIVSKKPIQKETEYNTVMPAL